MERSYGPKDWAKTDSKAIKAGAKALKRKTHQALYNIDDTITRKIPDMSDDIVSLLRKQGSKIGLKGKQTIRAVKAGVSQSKLVEILKKLKLVK